MEEKNKLGRVDIFLDIICALLFVDTISTNVAVGVPVVIYFIILGVIFMIPNGFITAELGGAYPDAGGIYGWIYRAFGSKSAARVSFLYWANVVVWLPSAFTWISGFIATLFFPNMGFWPQIILGIALIWLIIIIGRMPVANSKWIINAAGIAKLLLYIVLGICGLVYILQGNPAANEINASTLTPELSASMQYLPTIMICYCGFEVVSAQAVNMKNPKKDVPFVVIGSGILLLIMYLISSFSMLATTQVDNIDIMFGVLNVFSLVIGNKVMVSILGLLMAFSVFAQMCAWTSAAAVAIAESGENGEMPAVFGKKGKHAEPSGALLITGIGGTLLMLLYGFLAGGSAEALFWNMFAFSSVIYFMPYLFMYPAFLVLRKKDPHTERPFRCPCGTLAAVVCFIITAAAALLLIWVPGTPFDVANSLPTLIGLIVCFIIEELIIKIQVKKNAL